MGLPSCNRVHAQALARIDKETRRGGGDVEGQERRQRGGVYRWRGEESTPQRLLGPTECQEDGSEDTLSRSAQRWGMHNTQHHPLVECVERAMTSPVDQQDHSSYCRLSWRVLDFHALRMVQRSLAAASLVHWMERQKWVKQMLG